MNAANWSLHHQPFGGQILGAAVTIEGVPRDLLFVSAQSLGPRAPVRGGVPVMFPQFNELGPLPKHGLARTCTWRAVECQSDSVSGVAVSYEVVIGPESHPLWPHCARLRLTARARGCALAIELDVDNIGSSAFDWTGGLHPYFCSADLRLSALQGLRGCAMADRYDPAASRETASAIAWNGAPFERLYDSAPPLEFDSGDHRLLLSVTGFDQWMVWNPGEELGQSISDLAIGDWLRFVCIEPVRVTRPCRLEPGERFSGALSIEVAPRRS